MTPGPLNGLTDQQLLALVGSHPAPSPPHPAGSHPPTDQQLMALATPGAVANANPHMSSLEDWARSGVSGLEKGVTGLIGLPNLAGQASQWAGDQGANIARAVMGQAALTPQQHQQLHAVTQPINQALSPFGMANVHAPSNAQVNAGVQHVDQSLGGGGFHTPQSPGGRYAETIGEMASGAAMPGGLGARVARVVLPGVGAQAADDAAPEDMKPYARLAGAAAGGGIEGMGEAAFRAPAAAMGHAVGRITDDQIGLAQALRDHASAQGIQLTVPEAVAQVTGGDGGTRIQRLVESARRTAPAMAAQFEQRPAQVVGAVNNFVDSVSPGIANSDPGLLGLNAQRGALGVQGMANSARKAASGPAYQAADPQTVDPSEVQGILGRIDAQIAGDKTGLLSPELSRFRGNLTDQAGVPINDIGNLSTARNYWRYQTDLPPTSPQAIPKLQAGMIGNHLDDLEALLKSNPNYAAGNDAYATASRQYVDPINGGPIGRMAQTPNLTTQTGALYPANPPLGQAGSTGRALTALGTQDPTLPADLTAQHLGTLFNRSARNLTRGPNQYGGAVFARNAMGNTEQAATQNAGFDAIDPSGSLRDKFSDLVDTLQATGKRQPPGSMTAFNQEDQSALKVAPAVVRAFGGLGDPLEWTKNLSNWTGGKMYGRNLDVLAKMLWDPDTAGVLNAARAASPASPAAQLLLPLGTQNQGP